MITHGHDGWTLADYSWDARTGSGKFVYTRARVASDGEAEVQEERIVCRAQPALPSHQGFKNLD